jgi:hypothetical protein
MDTSISPIHRIDKVQECYLLKIFLIVSGKILCAFQPFFSDDLPDFSDFKYSVESFLCTQMYHFVSYPEE